MAGIDEFRVDDGDVNRYTARPKRRSRWPGPLFALLAATVVVVLAYGACSREQQPRIAIPEGIPPGPGAATPPIDINAPGRSADQLHGWSAGLADSVGVGSTALEAYGYAATVMAETKPECGIGVDDPRWNRECGEPARHPRRFGGRAHRSGDARDPGGYPPLDGGPGVAEIPPDTDGGGDGR